MRVENLYNTYAYLRDNSHCKVSCCPSISYLVTQLLFSSTCNKHIRQTKRKGLALKYIIGPVVSTSCPFRISRPLRNLYWKPARRLGKMYVNVRIGFVKYEYS